MKEIKLTQGKIALVDDEDFEYLNQFNWHIYKKKNSKTYYAQRTETVSGKNKRVVMHRVIMGLDFNDPRIVDHINHLGWDNRRSNVRICTVSENARNKQKNKDCSSAYKGVYLHKTKRFNKTKNIFIVYYYWCAKIEKENKKINIGNFKTEKAAALAYNIKAKELFGEFAFLNIV